MRVSRIAMAVGLVLAGCTVSQPRTGAGLNASLAHGSGPSRAAVPGSVNDPARYTYELLTPDGTGLVQVFDDTRNTYLTFGATAPAGLLIFDENGRAVPFTVGGRSAVVDGVRAGLLIRTPTKTSYAQAPQSATVARVKTEEAGGEEGAPWLPADLAAVRAEILRAQQRLMGLSAELDKATRGEPSTSLEQLRSEIEAIQVEIDGVNATLVRAHFAPGSALLALSADTKNAILAAAQRAHRIRIRGRADASGSAEGNIALARERALSMRRLLVDGGIAADKLHTSFTRGDYIAANSTLEGRAQNRRVDVVFENNKNEGVPVARNQSTEEGAR